MSVESRRKTRYTQTARGIGRFQMFSRSDQWSRGGKSRDAKTVHVSFVSVAVRYGRSFESERIVFRKYDCSVTVEIAENVRRRQSTLYPRNLFVS